MNDSVTPNSPLQAQLHREVAKGRQRESETTQAVHGTPERVTSAPMGGGGGKQYPSNPLWSAFKWHDARNLGQNRDTAVACSGHAWLSARPPTMSSGQADTDRPSANEINREVATHSVIPT